MDFWEWLEIEPTTDKKVIKKAYAAQVRDCHQEDEPERGVRLRDAYKQAMAWAERQGAPGQPVRNTQRQSLWPEGAHFYQNPQKIRDESQKIEADPMGAKERQTRLASATQAESEADSAGTEEWQREQEKEQEKALARLFDELPQKEKEREQSLQRQLWQALEKPIHSPKMIESVAWKRFFRSETTRQMCGMDEYWTTVAAVIKDRSMHWRTWNRLNNELYRLNCKLASEAVPQSVRNKARSLYSYCVKKRCETGTAPVSTKENFLKDVLTIVGTMVIIGLISSIWGL